ncbi:MAG: hypothetical protein H6731_04895 [Myxococcales bacterium]|nr:MAG: hypothetical protein H6731_04895 [Myxococcales bacterium]
MKLTKIIFVPMAIFALSFNALAGSENKDINEKTFDIGEKESATLGRAIYIWAPPKSFDESYEKKFDK